MVNGRAVLLLPSALSADACQLLRSYVEFCTSLDVSKACLERNVLASLSFRQIGAPQTQNTFVPATKSMLHNGHCILLEVLSSTSKLPFLWTSKVSCFGVSCEVVCGICLSIAQRVSFSKISVPITLVIQVFFHGAEINDLLDGVSDTAPRILA